MLREQLECEVVDRVAALEIAEEKSHHQQVQFDELNESFCATQKLVKKLNGEISEAKRQTQAAEQKLISLQQEITATMNR